MQSTITQMKHELVAAAWCMVCDYLKRHFFVLGGPTARERLHHDAGRKAPLLHAPLLPQQPLKKRARLPATHLPRRHAQS